MFGSNSAYGLKISSPENGVAGAKSYIAEKLVATIAISGTKAYADYGIEEGVIASTAVVTLADGTTQTIENVACAAGFGTLGIGARTDDGSNNDWGSQFTWSSVKVNALSTYDVPEFAD